MLSAWQVEYERIASALTEGNQGKARVCARRAVGAWMMEKFPQYAEIQGNDAMKIIRALSTDVQQPQDVQLAAERLAGGLRAELQGGVVSDNPRADVDTIIAGFVSVR